MGYSDPGPTPRTSGQIAKELLGNNLIMLIGFSGENLVVPLAMKLISEEM